MSDTYRVPDHSEPGHQAQHPHTPAGGGKGPAVAALVTGILSLLLLWLWFVGIPLALVAIGLGIAAVRKARRGADGRGMAITGIVLGSVSVLIAVALVAIGVSILNSDEGKDLTSCLDKAQTQAQKQDCTNRFSNDMNK
ncbi:DUF4190 domain-containing protein [Streptomyces sp. NPDC006512]|uniref:DUF4190 domain-containing protein n=1 Tax=Streptomyces sp. NPDC006512 TaxID=3154307 RepID=UPI0033A17A23